MIKEKAKTHALATAAKIKTLSLGDWGSIASIAAIGIWVVGKITKR